MTKLSPGQICIPKSQLRQQLEEAAAIQRDMAEQLRRLEEQAAGQTVAKTGVWRHHPEAWPAAGRAK
jgi:hypothetical protein